MKKKLASFPRVGIGVMILRNDHILLGRRKGSLGEGSFGFPGGHLEIGESLEECAIREVREETGLVVKSLELICISTFIIEQSHYIEFDFLTKIGFGSPVTCEQNRVESWNWFDIEKLPDPLFPPAIPAFQCLKEKQFNIFGLDGDVKIIWKN